MNRIYKDSKGREYKYVIFVPFALTAASRPPMLVYLNGLAENGDDGITAAHGPMGSHIWEMKARFPFVTVFPQCSFNGSWQSETDSSRALAIIEQVAREYHTDLDRVYLTGASSGGTGTWAIAAAAPDRFAAIVPLCGAGSTEGIVPPLAISQIPIWSFCKSQDEIGSAEREREVYHALLDAGSSPHYTELPGRGHDCWNYAYRNPALYEWLLQQTRPKNRIEREFGPFVNLLPGKSLEGWRQSPALAWSTDSDNSLRIPEMAECATLKTANQYEDYDLHLEFMLGSAEGFKIWLKCNGEIESRKRVGLYITTPNVGSGGLFEFSHEKWLCPTDCVAQRSMVRNAWNDLRIRVHNDQVAVELNGYNFLNCEVDSLSNGPTPIALEAGPRSGTLRWRNLRFRKLTQ